MQTVIPLPGGGAMRLTTARYYTPSGRSIQATGIVPDVKVDESRDEPASFGLERESDYNKVLSNSGGTRPAGFAASYRPAGDRQADSGKTAGGVPKIRSPETR